MHSTFVLRSCILHITRILKSRIQITAQPFPARTEQLEAHDVKGFGEAWVFAVSEPGI